MTSNSSSVVSDRMAQLVTNMATSTTAVTESDPVDTGSDPKESGADRCPHYWQSTIFHWLLLTSWRQFSSQPFQTVKRRSSTPASRQKQHAFSMERLCCVFGEAGGPNASGAICMKEAFCKHSLLWNSCVGVSMDTTAIDMDKKNSIVTRVTQETPSLYVMGCPWHLAHNTAVKAAVVFESGSVGHVLSCYNSINAHVLFW